ncbi:MAG: tyrosine-type recombinase/integrase [Methylorubrum rhodinum]|uniref:tyrosine-type recombinase/integrase n=1 Tax=Methylorubrum rhodinum TaxID=29428 RepID=UPI003BB0CE68
MAERLNHSRQLPPGEVTLAEVFKEYHENHGARLRSGPTIKILLRYWLEFWGTASVSDARDVQRQEAFRTFLEAKGLRHNSVNRVLEIGRAALNRAHRRGVIATVPHIHCLEVENLRPMGDPLTVDQLRRLYWQGSEEPHFRLYLLLALGTGGRPEAITTLTWPQVDLERGIINLNPDGRRQTSKRRARVKVGPALIDVLLALPQDTPRVIMFRGRTLGRMVHVWPKARERTKLKGRVNAYSLRHTVASYLREMDVPPWEASHFMGHRMDGHSMTERYTHMSPAYHKNAAAALDGLIRAVLADPLPYEGKQVKFTSERSRAVNAARKASRAKSVPPQELRP